MRSKCWIMGLVVPALLLAGPGCAPAVEPKEPSSVDVKVVKYNQLKEAIQKAKGKVVVVDFWADT